MLQKRLSGQEFQSAAVMADADQPQVTIALQNLVSGHHRSRRNELACCSQQGRPAEESRHAGYVRSDTPSARLDGTAAGGVHGPNRAARARSDHRRRARAGRRTVAAALRAAGYGQAADFTSYHRVLNRNRWSPRHMARRLLLLLVQAFTPEGPVIIGIDDTLERRWGAKIKARGIYRDPVRSSHGHFVKASGLRWLSVMLLSPIPWTGRVWALPFLTVLAPSERY